MTATFARVYTRCTYCGKLTYRNTECGDCGYTGHCMICGDTLEDETRRSHLPQVCATPSCQREWDS